VSLDFTDFIFFNLSPFNPINPTKPNEIPPAIMLSKITIGLAALAGLAAAETHMVWVGQGGLTISPDEIRAKVGDKVAFHFGSSGHDVAQGPFGSPCTPSDNGFYSGAVPRDGVFTVDVTDTTPKWVYCSVGQHCASGMVAVINPP
jgi:plastocyanin